MTEHTATAMPGVWGVDPAMFDELREAWERRPAVAGMADDLAPGVKGRRFPPPAYSVSDTGEARIFVRGLLLSDASGWADLLWRYEGSVRYEDLLATVRAAVRDPMVSTIVLDWDSRGGMVAGAFEAAEELYALARQKPITSYARGHCASCAYWLASSTLSVDASPTAPIGSIGVMLDTVDRTQLEASVGIVRKTFVSRVSPRKDHRTPEAASDTQAMVDAMAAVFVAAVARNRGVSEDHVVEQMGQGGCLLGQRALDARLCDSIVAAAPAPTDAPDPDAPVVDTTVELEPGGGKAKAVTLTPGAARASTQEHTMGQTPDRAADPTATASELEQLKAENERLRAQVAARDEAQGAFRSQLEQLQKRQDERTVAEYEAARDKAIATAIDEARYNPGDGAKLVEHADKMSGRASGAIVGPEALGDFKAILALAPKGGARPMARAGAAGSGSTDGSLSPFLEAAKAVKAAGSSDGLVDNYVAELAKRGLVGEV